MVKMIASRGMRYGTRHLVAGEVFDANGRDARILALLRRAGRYIEPKAVEPPKSKARRAVAPVEPAVEPVEAAGLDDEAGQA